MTSLNETILGNLLQERNLALAKKSIFLQNGEEVPKHFTDRVATLEAAIAEHERMILADRKLREEMGMVVGDGIKEKRAA